tara:strand:+ start:156 stop:533 length:378 start_codon:yes stop_codon:yes gene_type:complete
MITPSEIEVNTANTWLKSGAIGITSYGSENTYYENEFGKEFFCKNYPVIDPSIKDISTLNALTNPLSMNDQVLIVGDLWTVRQNIHGEWMLVRPNRTACIVAGMVEFIRSIVAFEQETLIKYGQA